MSEQLLLSIIMCLCKDVKPLEQAKQCVETYANCAIVQDGKILSIKQFDKKCYFIKDQEKCY